MIVFVTNDIPYLAQNTIKHLSQTIYNYGFTRNNVCSDQLIMEPGCKNPFEKIKWSSINYLHKNQNKAADSDLDWTTGNK